MIDFALSEENELLRATARRFAEEQLRPAEREAEADRRPAARARSRFSETGLERLEWPERLGGGGPSAVARALVSEELGAGDPGAALALDPLGPALYPLLELGDGGVLDRLVARLQGGGRAVLHWDGEARLAERSGRLTGSIPWVPADEPQALVVLQRERAYLVEQGIVSRTVRGAGLRAAGAAEIELDAAPIEAAIEGEDRVSRALARARVYVAGLLVGCMRDAAEYSRAYALERVAFGRPIAHHQALAFLIADMAAAVDGARLLLWEAAWRIDRAGDEAGREPGEDATLAAALAFAEAAEQALFVTPNAIQILGGHGFMQDHPVEKRMREARALASWADGAPAAREDAGDALAAAARRAGELGVEL